jgi:hypothetical protein
MEKDAESRVECRALSKYLTRVLPLKTRLHNKIERKDQRITRINCPLKRR